MRVGAETFRLVGIGAATRGTRCTLEDGMQVVIGRDSACTLVLRSGADDEEDGASVSRHHAVIEQMPGRGWCVYDTGSTNGTAILSGGRPPARRLAPGESYALQSGDVVELASSTAYQFKYERRPV